MDKLELSIFDLSPIAMWIQDFSGVKTIFEQWQAQGIQDIRQYLLEDPERLHPCLATIKTIHVNQSALTLYEAENIEEILQNFAQLHTEKISVHHAHFLQIYGIKKKFAQFLLSITPVQVNKLISSFVPTSCLITRRLGSVYYSQQKIFQIIKMLDALPNLFSSTHLLRFG